MIPKFRAWDKENEKMYDVTSIWFDRNNDQYKLGHIAIPSQETVDVIFDHYELMQSTGLKDKNGAEIFEGDIVRIIDDGEVNIGWGWNEAVIFHNEAFMAGDENLLINVNFRCVAIGSIYENPEFLEVEG